MSLGINFEGIKLPFSANELLTSGVGLLGVVGAFILLGLAFLMARKLFSLIFSAFGLNSDDGAQRDQYGNRVHFQSRAAKAEFAAYKKEKGWK